MNWFKKRDFVQESIERALVKERERKSAYTDESLDRAHEYIVELRKEIEALNWKLENPKKYTLGQVVNGYTIYEIEYSETSVIKFHCFNEPSWIYKGINNAGEKINVQ